MENWHAKQMQFVGDKSSRSSQESATLQTVTDCGNYLTVMSPDIIQRFSQNNQIYVTSMDSVEHGLPNRYSLTKPGWFGCLGFMAYQPL